MQKHKFETQYVARPPAPCNAVLGGRGPTLLQQNNRGTERLQAVDNMMIISSTFLWNIIIIIIMMIIGIQGQDIIKQHNHRQGKYRSIIITVTIVTILCMCVCN